MACCSCRVCPLPGDSPFARLMQIHIIDRPERGLILSPFIYMFTFVPVTPFPSINAMHTFAGQVDGNLINIFDAVRKIYFWAGGFTTGCSLKLSVFFKKIPAVRTSTASTNMLYSPTSNSSSATHKRTLRHHNMTHD